MNNVSVGLAVLLFLVPSGCSGGGSSDDPGDTDSPGDPDTDPPSDLPTILVNEVMSSNAATLQDEAGAFPDWFELYNPNATAVDLGGWWLTHDTLDPFEWQLAADTTIEAGGYLVLFADGDTIEGSLHAPFKLAAAGGDDLALYGPDADGNPLVDALENMQQLTTDISLARSPDGSEAWQTDDSPSPGESND